MASKTVSFAILFAIVAAVQGSSFKELAVEYSQMLAEQLSTGVEEIERLKESSLDQVSKNHHDILAKLVSSANNKVEQHASDCHPAAKEEVHKEVSQTVTNRFLHCINFTNQITELEKLIYNVSEQVDTVESGVCLAITNLTGCSGEGVVEEIHCLTAGLLGYINDFTQHSSAIKNIIAKFNEELRLIGNQFLKCFTTVDNDAITYVQQSIETKC